ncbi:prepronociceptin [Stigmatopora argus]
MKMLVALLMALLLCVNGVRSDCQDDCLSCSQILPKQLAFNIAECLFECEASDTPPISWDACRRSLSLSPMPKRSQEEVDAMFPAEEDVEEGGEGLPLALHRLDRITQALAPDQSDPETHDYLSTDADEVAPSISKRFGGFVKGRHGYRKLMAPARSYQKRYGGFIGIRKSARKWNNQKRFSEFLKQYLGMSTRATEYNSVSEELSHQNQV